MSQQPWRASLNSGLVRRSRPNLLVSPLENPAAATDLVSFLKVLPDCRLRRGIRYPQWRILLVEILAILSYLGSLLGARCQLRRRAATDAGAEIVALRQLLDRVDLNGLRVQADALHANRPFSYLERGAEFLQTCKPCAQRYAVKRSRRKLSQ